MIVTLRKDEPTQEDGMKLQRKSDLQVQSNQLHVLLLLSYAFIYFYYTNTCLVMSSVMAHVTC